MKALTVANIATEYTNMKINNELIEKPFINLI